MEDYIKYEMIIYWSKEDDAFIVEFLNCRAVWLMAKHMKKL